MILVGGLVPALIFIPKLNYFPNLIPLTTTWQIPSLLLCSMIFGPKSAVIASIAYLTIGLVYLPIFHGGGSIGYLLTPEFGYLAGFIPASLMTGTLTARTKKNNLIGLTFAAMAGVAIIQFIGIINIVVGAINSRWTQSLYELMISYSFSTVLSQLILCPAIALIAIVLKKMFFIK